jgi:hypothetical protein
MGIDYFNINDSSLKNQVFYFIGTGTTSWQTWIKPPNCKFVNFFLVGGGAGGQGGAINAASTRSGGAGGGSAAFSYITVPAFTLPDILYIQVGGGGQGGASGGSQGGVGGLSYVCSIPDTTTTYNILMKSGTAGAGTSTSATAGTIIVAADILLAEVGLISAYAGQAGGAGGSSSNAATNVTPSGKPFTGGAGGAGCSSVGTLGTSASVLGILDFPTISGGTNTSSAGATANPGNNGYATRENFIGPNFRTPMYFTGGAGGGAASSTTGIGGKGGDGAFGCGGGGGGAGGNSTAGVGGRGGDGFVIVTVS